MATGAIKKIWVNDSGGVSYTNGSADTSTPTSVKRNGNVVVLQGLSTGSNVTTSWAKLGQINGSAFYPSSIATGICQAGFTSIQIRVLTSGEVQIRGGTSLSNQGIRYNLVWIV